MRDKLIKLAESLIDINVAAANKIFKLAGRHDKVVIKLPTKMQHAYKYIMYLKCMRNLDDQTFHRMKRKYLDTSQKLQKECYDELNKIISEDARSLKLPSSTIRVKFYNDLKKFENDPELWAKYFETKLGKRSG
jgi:hypothetical protein